MELYLPNPRSQSEIEDVLCLTFPMAMLKVFLWSSVHKAVYAMFCHERRSTTVKVTFVVLTLGESESLSLGAADLCTFSSHGFKLGHSTFRPKTQPTLVIIIKCWPCSKYLVWVTFFELLMYVVDIGRKLGSAKRYVVHFYVNHTILCKLFG